MTGSVISAGGASRRQPVLWAVLAVSLALNLALLGFTLLARGATAAGGAAESFDRAAWYSVFLDNKEAFVGHITSLNATTVAMDHLYYLTFEAKDAAGNAIPNPKPEDFKPTLKKLGQEIWGPEDFIRLDRIKIEYYTKLRPDSPVVAAINKYQTPAPAPSAPAPAASPKK